MSDETQNEMITTYHNEVKININTTPIIETNKKDSNKIAKISIMCDIGKITWKPKIEKESFKDGFKVVDTEQMTFPTLPKLLKEIALKVQDKGKCEMSVSYTLGTVGEDKDKKEYMFITSENTLNKWKFL